jgi:hypothetical protein
MLSGATIRAMTTVAFPLRPPSAPHASRFDAFLLRVTFAAPGGERRAAIGGGVSVAEAIAAARDELPRGRRWTLARWNHLYGE